MWKILSESAGFCRRCDKNILFWIFVSQFQFDVHLQNANAKFDKVV